MHDSDNAVVPVIYVELAATILMDIWAADKSLRAGRANHYFHAFTNPIFQVSEFGWLPILAARVNEYLMAACNEGWALLDRDFSREIDLSNMAESDLD